MIQTYLFVYKGMGHGGHEYFCNNSCLVLGECEDLEDHH